MKISEVRASLNKSKLKWLDEVEASKLAIHILTLVLTFIPASAIEQVSGEPVSGRVVLWFWLTTDAASCLPLLIKSADLIDIQLNRQRRK